MPARESHYDRMTCHRSTPLEEIEISLFGRSGIEDAVRAVALRRTFRNALTAATVDASPAVTRDNVSGKLIPMIGIIVSPFPCQG